MRKRLTALKIVQKRFLEVSDKVLDTMQDQELLINDKLLDFTKKTKLDPIKKKKLSKKDLCPLETAPLEWWYFTGHLESGKKKFGYEYCFFKFHPQVVRIGPIPLKFFKKKPFLVFHFALTDKDHCKFDYMQDSGVLEDDQKINYDKLELKLEKSNLSFDKKFKIATKNNLANLELDLTPIKDIIKHFEDGYTMMWEHPQHRTYYLTYPRLKTSGKLKIGKHKYNVKGQSWFDHQKLNLQHKTPLKGWDWFSIMLDDNTELMLFLLRSKKGVNNEHMGGSYINKKSQITNLKPKDFDVKVLEHWKSPRTGVTYPSAWEIKIPKLKMTLNVTPAVQDQELGKIIATPITYWEGACDVSGIKKGRKIKGQSYVELVGYDQRFRMKFLQKMLQ